MQLILLERVAKLGNIGDVVTVKDGYARNFLLPKLKALRATPKNIEIFKTKEKDIIAKSDKKKAEANVIANKINDISVVIVRQASESGFLFGSVRPLDIIGELVENGITGIQKNQVIIDTPIKTIGNHTVKVCVHPEVIIDLPVRVVMEQELGSNSDEEEEVYTDISDVVEITDL